MQQRHYSLQFRFDEVIEIECENNSLMFFELISEYLRQPENYISVKWAKNMMLFADNGATIHGRKAFPEDQERSLKEFG